jgi:hypothetical protein
LVAWNFYVPKLFVTILGLGLGFEGKCLKPFINLGVLIYSFIVFGAPQNPEVGHMHLTNRSKYPLLLSFFVMDVLLRCKGPPLSQQHTLLQHFVMQKNRIKRKLLEFLSNSMISGSHQEGPINPHSYLKSLHCRHGPQVCDQQTWVYCSHYFFAALALVLISSYLGQVLSYNPFL